MPEYIPQGACLLQFTAKCWSGTKSLPESAVEAITRRPNTPWLVFRGRKSLVEPGRLEPIKNVIGLTRRHIKRFCLPFPIANVYLLSKDAADSLQPRLDEMKRVFEQLVEAFDENLADAVIEAERHLGEHFQQWDYPVDMKSKFSFGWRFMSLPGAIPGEVQETEIQKFTDLMAEARNLAMAGLRKQFAVVVSHLVKELSADGRDRPKIIKNDVFDRLLNFFDEFKAKNIFKDEELARLVEEAQVAISGLDEGDDLSQRWLTEHLRSQFTTLKERIDESIMDRPRRLIRPQTPPVSSAGG